MKHTIKMALIAIAAMFAVTSFAQTSVQTENIQDIGGNPYSTQSILTLKNYTNNTVTVSFVYYDPIDQCWVSRGWRNIPANGSNTINFGVYTGSVYIHGASNNNGQMLTWGSGRWFCVENGSVGGGFRITHPERTNGCDNKRQYSRVELIAGQYKEYVFNP